MNAETTRQQKSTLKTDDPTPALGQCKRGRTVLELFVIIPLTIVWFFWGTGVGDFVETEALRSVIVKEMQQSGDWVIPTVHGRTYLRKPPLYAWTTYALSEAVGHLDEQVCRWPSAALGVLFVITLYFTARWLIDERAGPAAAVFGAGNWMVLNYGMRAELDVGVLAWTTLAMALLYYAYTKEGGLRVLALIGCYLAALIGSFWKAPHVLVAVWLTVIGLAWKERKLGESSWWRFALHPAQITLSVISLGVLAGWFALLSSVAGTTETGKYVFIEFLARVVPHSLSYLGDLLFAVPQFIAVALPAALFAAVWLMTPVYKKLNNRQRGSLYLLAAWFLPVFVFLMIVPAKAARYWFLVLGAALLLGTFGWRLFINRQLPPQADRFCDWSVRGLFIATLVVGAGLLISSILVMTDVLTIPGTPEQQATSTMLACGLLILGLSGTGLQKILVDQRKHIGMIVVFVLLALKPVQVNVLLPLRAELASLRPTAVKVDQIVPEGRTVYVLSDRPGSDREGDLADIGYYSQRHIYWPPYVEDALSACGQHEAVWILVKEQALERLKQRFGERITRVEPLAWSDINIYLLRLECPPTTQPAETRPTQAE